MTTSLQTDPRRSLRASGSFAPPARGPLEMPVLFQLADLSLSQFKVITPHAAAGPPVEQNSLAETTTAMGPAEEGPAGNEGAQNQGRREGATILQTVPQPITEETPQVISAAIEASPGQAEAIETLAATMAAAGATAGSEGGFPARDFAQQDPAPAKTSPKPLPPDPPPRERAEPRGRNRPLAPIGSDWMRTHGKFIAVGFVICLIATIYLAQNGDEPAPPRHDESVTQDIQATHQSAAAESESKITAAHTAVESSSSGDHGQSPALVGDANPATEGRSQGSRAELRLPVPEETAKELSQAAGANSLFPWKDAAEPRVASKPEESPARPKLPGLIENPTVPPRREAEASPSETKEAPSLYGPAGNSHPSPAQSDQPPAAGDGPQLQAPAAYPLTNPGSFRDFSPQQPALQQPALPPTGSPPPRATPASFQNNGLSTPRTSGPRYERTGSGLY